MIKHSVCFLVTRNDKNSNKQLVKNDGMFPKDNRCLKKYPLLNGNMNDASGQLNVSIFNFDLNTLRLKIVLQTPGIQACNVKIYSAPENRGFEKWPSHDLHHGYFPKHL